MKKTKEQIKIEVLNYLNKTSLHTFVKPKATYKYATKDEPGHYEYDYNDTTYFKVFKDGDLFKVLENGKVRVIDVDGYIDLYFTESKAVIKRVLFLNKKVKSIRNNKFVKSEIEELLTLSKV